MSVLKPKFSLKNALKNAFLAFLFAFLTLSLTPLNAFAELRTPERTQETPQQTQQTQAPQRTTETRTPGTLDSENTSQTQTQDQGTNTENKETEDICSSQTGAIGWLVCPTTGFIAKAIDGIYSVTESALVVAPLSSDSSSPIYLVWSYFRSITNVVFIIFILIIIISQLTGLGISNYGIKKTLPKIVVTAILVNLSWIICALAVDLSNILGASFRTIFEKIAESTISAESISAAADVSWGAVVSVIAGGGALAVGTILVTANVGIFYMLIPLLLGALVAVISGLLTIAMRQALVALLIMISPLAFVCFLLPNTESWFNKWKGLLTQMLIFYPMFSILFGASELAGWVLIASAKDAFTVILGIAVQIFPLIFSWSMMKMSNTVLGKVNSGLRSLAAPAQKSATSYATRKRELANARYLGINAKYNSPRKLAQFLDKNKRRDLADTKTYLAAAENRGLAAAATYKRRSLLDPKKTVVTGRGEALFSLVNQNLSNQETIERGKNDFNQGISEYAKGTRRFKRLEQIDIRTMNASDTYNMELARGEMINLENATNRHKRFEAALSAHSQLTLDKPGLRYNPDQVDIDRYNTISGIMEGKGEFIHYAGAYAANAHAVQDKIIDSKFANYFDSIAPTQEVVNRLTDLTNYRKSNDYIDSIVMGMKTLNMRGDTDLVKDTIDQILVGDQIKLGTHASQALANFLMFDVKDNDPFLRRYGKYINLETAAVYNEGGKRTNHTLTFDEYIRGEYPEIDPATGKAKRDKDGNIIYTKAKRDVVKLMEGTSFDGVERTAYENMDKSIKRAFMKEDGTVDEEAWLKRRNEIQNSILPAIISAGLKYPSGSEQIQSLASYMTGYKVDKTGKLVPRWEDKGDIFYGVDPKKFFEDQTDIFLGAQTPSQILGIRTDLLNPIIETLADEYLAIHGEDELPENYDSLSAEEKAKLEKDRRFAYAKKQLFELLDKKGKLEQIYTSRRSGAGLGSKDKVRDLLDLDDDYLITKYRKKKSDERKKRREEIEAKLRAEGHSEDDASSHPAPTYDNFEYFSGEISELYNDDPDSGTFFKDSYKLLQKFGLNYIAYLYKEYREANETADNEDLINYLFELLDNPENYM